MRSWKSILSRSVVIVLLSQILFAVGAIGQGSGVGMYRAVHMGGNWGKNPFGIPQQPQDYYDFLRDLGVNWAAISIALHLQNSMDSTIERAYDDPGVPGFIPTFRDEPLIDAIRGFRRNNINVCLTLAFETTEAAQSLYPFNRTDLGDPFAPDRDSRIQRQYWPWDPPHPNHQSFINAFWRTYTEQAVYFARIAQTEGVKMFALGTETDRLFRTRSGGPFPNHFKDQIKAMVDSVRTVFSGLVSYDLHWGALADTLTFGPGSDHLWEDAGLDVVGVSAYFQLAQQTPTSVMSVAQLETSWEDAFTRCIIPLKNRNPNRPMLFLEFGYVDVVGSPFSADLENFSTRIFKDDNQNGKDDGEETQANIHEAFFKVNEQHNRIVQGVFLWGNDISTNADWQSSFGNMRTHSIRNKLAAQVVKTYYAQYAPALQTAPLLHSPSPGALDVPTSAILKWGSVADAATYQVQVAGSSDFSVVAFDSVGIVDTTVIARGLESQQTYHWRVRGQNLAGYGPYSMSSSFVTMAAAPAAPVLISPPHGSTGVSTQPTLSWSPSTNATTYRLQVSTQSSFSPLVLDDSTLTTTSREVGPLGKTTMHYWRVSAKNAGGSSPWSTVFSFTTQATSALEEGAIVITEYRLLPNYPNPFNPTTIISYQIPQASNVRLKIYNALGVELATLINQEQPPGFYKLEFVGADLPSGTYFARVRAGSFFATQKLVLLR
jgi:hypothetical protein